MHLISGMASGRFNIVNDLTLEAVLQAAEEARVTGHRADFRENGQIHRN